MTDRPTLEADLARHRQSGNFAAQAETLFALADIAYENEEYSIAHGLYGQAWEAYERAGNKRGMGDAILRISESIGHFWWQDEFTDPNESVNVTLLHAMALAIYQEIGDQTSLAHLYSHMAYSHLYSADTTRGCLRAALTLYEALDNIPKQAEMLKELMNWHAYDVPEAAGWVTRAQTLYQLMDDKQGEINVLYRAYGYSSDSAFSQQAIDRVHELYRQLGDQHGEAKFYLSTGALYLTDKNYEMARHALEAAFRMSMQLQAYEHIPNILWNLCILSEQADGYDAYRRTHEEAIRSLRALELQPHNLYQLLCDTARRHRDFVTARYGFQQAIGLDIALGRPEQQPEKLWLWGRMEYDEADRKQMGLMLCAWAVTLGNRYFPGQNRYHRKLRIMRREMRPHPMRRSS